MHSKLLPYYEQELKHIREAAAEFALEHPKVAKRLALNVASSGGECPDPYVERLLEGFAFLAARVQLKQDSEYSKFTQHLLELIYPGFLAPLPSMLIAQLLPDLDDAGLATGPRVPRHSAMLSRLLPGERTACKFRIAQEVRLWPLQVRQARYQAHVTDLSSQILATVPRARACLRICFQVTASLVASKLSLDTLTLYLSGSESVAHRIFEQLFAQCLAVAVYQPSKRTSPCVGILPAQSLVPGGLRDDEALLPPVSQSFGGYRLLKEYAAMPERYLFAHINGLQELLSKIDADEFEILFLMDRADTVLEKTVDVGGFMLHCVPAVNLFPKRAERIEVKPGQHEHHLVADNGQPMNFEVHSVTAVGGIDDSGVQKSRQFRAIYNRQDMSGDNEQAFYSIRRMPRLLSKAQLVHGPRTGYVGTEVYLSLVDPNDAPISGLVSHLSVETLCSNRDLPITLSVGSAEDFSFEDSFPIQGIRCIKGPTRPVAPALEGETPWRLLSHLQLNYLSLVDGDAREGAASLREMLTLYGADPRSPLHKQVEGVISVISRSAICRVPVAGPITFGRGVQVELTLDERAFEGTSILVLATVMERFLARHASINSFVQMVLLSQSRGEVKRWMPRIGLRAIA